MPYDANGNWVADTVDPSIDTSGNLSLTPANSATGGLGGFFSNLDYSILSKNIETSKLVLDPSYSNKILNWSAQVEIENGCKKLLM